MSASAGGEGRGGRGQLRGEEAREERGGVRPAHGLRGRWRLRGGRQWVSLLVHHIILVYTTTRECRMFLCMLGGPYRKNYPTDEVDFL